MSHEMTVCYTYNEKHGVYQRKAIAPFDYSDSDECENFLLKTLQAAEDRSFYSDELAEKIRDWPTCCHLGPMRSFLLYPFKGMFKDKNVLEIGSGCGAMTRAMADFGAKISAVEGSLQRAAITRLRCEDCADVNVYCDNFIDFSSSEKFDIVTLIGVLEYSPRFINGENPALRMLAKAKSFLKPDGRLIIAIENRMGLKYLSGMPEDHLGIPYAGVYGNYDGTGTITFGRSELCELLEKADLPEYEFHYPFPDYKLPNLILHPKALTHQELRIHELLCGNAGKASPYRLSESLTWEGLEKNNLIQDFANSFLVLCGKSFTDDKCLASWYSRFRKKNFSKKMQFISTDSGIKVKSGPVFPEEALNNSTKIVSLSCTSEEPYLSGRLYFIEFVKLVSDPDWELASLADLFRKWLLWLNNGASVTDISEELKASPECFDAFPRNLIMTDDGFEIFDHEFELKREFSLLFVAFRGVLNTLSDLNIKHIEWNNESDRCLCTLQILNMCGIRMSQDAFQEYIQLETDIQNEIVQGNMHNSFLADDIKNRGAGHALPELKEYRKWNIQSEKVFQDYSALQKEYIVLSRQIDTISNSASWKVTRPVRICLDAMKRVERIDRSLSFLKKRIKLLKKYVPLALLSNMKNKIRSRNNYPENGFEYFKKMPKRFEFPVPKKKPVVSIVVPVYNQWKHTVKCLYSVLRNTSGATYEIIVADDNSSDNTRKINKYIKNITCVRNKSNLGFLRNCNNAVRHCSGKYIVFLNNDTIPQKGWLRPFVEMMEKDPSVGGVGAKLIFPDGTMQEAGSIIWNDGSSMGYGRGDDPDKPEYSFVREVDFCSGAAIMYRREEFIFLGCFDERYAPAYYEETDFSMTLRKNGYKLMFLPQSIVIHTEFASSGVSEGIELQKRNQKLLREKWKNELNSHYPYSEQNIINARIRSRKRRILIVDDIVPDTSQGAGFPRASVILECLNKDMLITYYQTNPSTDIAPGFLDELQGKGVELLETNCLNKAEHLKNLLSSRKGYYDVIWVSRERNMNMFNKIPRNIYKGTKIVYDAEVIVACRNIIFRKLFGERISSTEEEELIFKEVSSAAKADAVITVSKHEEDIFQKYGCGKTCVLGHAVDVVPSVTPFESRGGLLFVGRIHESADNPNYDSMIFFINNVFGKILEIIPNLELHIVGICDSPALLKMNHENIVIHGCVPDTKPFYEKHKIFIAPTRIAAGIPLKLLEAASNGVPIVATSLLAGQFDWKNNSELLTADTPEEFVREITRLYNDEAFWEQLRNNAIDRVRKDFSKKTFNDTLREMMSNLLS